MMWRIKNYRFGFDPWGLVLFLVMLLPNFLWAVLPAPNDVLRRESVTPLIDAAAQGFQLALAASLCAVVNTTGSKPMKRGDRIGAAVCAVLYYAGWAAYYAGIPSAAVILSLCLAPCGAFLFFALGRKNAAALVSAAAFAACHLVFAMVNFIM